MDINEIEHLYRESPRAGALIRLLEDRSVERVFLQGLMASATPLLFASIAEKSPQTILFILSDADEAGYFFNDLNLEPASGSAKPTVGRTLFFPSSYRRAVKYGQRDAANEILRTEVLSALTTSREGADRRSLYIVTYPAAVAELVVSKQKLSDRRLTLTIGQTADVTEIVHTLRDFGFEEQDYVYEPGQFALRGSILDVYSYACEDPFRIDFFGDEIDTIRTFEVQDQLSKDRRTDVEIVPELASISSERVPFLRFLPDDTLIMTKDPASVLDAIDHIYREGFSGQALHDRLEGATEMERQQIMRDMQRENTLCSASQWQADFAGFRQIVFGPNAGTRAKEQGDDRSFPVLDFHISPQPLFHKNFQLLKETLSDYLLQGYRLYILADSRKQQQRLRDIFQEMGSDRERSSSDAQRSAVDFTPIDRTVHEGFADQDLKACFFTDHQIFDRFHKFSLKSDGARSGKMALSMKEIQEMKPGDYIVHIDFGIGKFGGLVRLPTADGGYQEVIRIIYQHNDKVDVSIHSLYKISKYRRQDTGEPPHLSTLGTGAWDRLKERTKRKIKDIARDLIRLYSKRRMEKGYAFSADSFMQHELEASFLYEDTPDQLKATQEVKADMESSRPMDRLVCGDVGFGKTEVAIRAAFKAACDSKQVAVLVPTTVLAFQHYQTFRGRLKDLPVRVDYLTRARTAAQTKQVLEDLKAGKIDILIGTHKLISQNVKWHDLGLLIIDEEQKFGVATKEKLRKLKTNVDTLTMSATPIPRTLQFSLMGARDMSIIRTPPPNRHPIHTELGTFGHELIADAINFEMSRNGQVFFVNDRISNLPQIASLIRKYVPDCRVAIGHGQMSPEELERIIMGFIDYDYDVLLSTTIVENGIDIPNANTIIINDAHRFGLSDLHQMRGRVGRSNKKAFCYLLAPPKSVLTPEARRRLEALENLSELGSGFNLAMQDLDIRGAGNLLGAEQSGFMEDLGYETYLKIIKQAMTELRNEGASPVSSEREGNASADSPHPLERAGVASEGAWDSLFVDDCTIESDLEMYFPDTYVPGSGERMLLYRELDNITDDKTLAQYRQRLLDRFGPVPHEGEELLQVVALRRLGKRLGCEKIILRQGVMNMQFVSAPDSPYYCSPVFGRVLDYIATHPRRCNLKEIKGRRLMHIDRVATVGEAVSLLREMERKD